MNEAVKQIAKNELFFKMKDLSDQARGIACNLLIENMDMREEMTNLKIGCSMGHVDLIESLERVSEENGRLIEKNRVLEEKLKKYEGV